MQGYPLYAALDGTVWVKDVKFDGKYLTYTERMDDWRYGVKVRFFDKYGNMARAWKGGSISKEDGVWRTRDNVEPGDGVCRRLKGEVTEIQFYRIHVWLQHNMGI